MNDINKFRYHYLCIDESVLTKRRHINMINENEEFAKKGDAKAQYILGNEYYKLYNLYIDRWELPKENEIDIKKYREKAIEWLNKSVEQGYADAQYKLGSLYLDGELRVLQDYETAMSLFLKAAKQGHGKAMNSIGYMYSLGKGVLQDSILAYMWFNIAATKTDDPLIIRNRDRETGNLSTIDLVKAQQKSKRCLESNFTDCGI